jgi:predicted transcriptional regulator
MTRLGMALAAYQQKYDMENREIAKQIGIPASSLSRIKSGTMPDAIGMVKIMVWLSAPEQDK